jgi:glycosyl transferase family 7 (putative galactosyltransferase)
MAFVPHMEKFLNGLKFNVMVIEQGDAKPFNRGKLLNIGFILAREKTDRMCFHDVDMLPEDESCDYSFPHYTTHLAGCVEQFGYGVPFPEYLGGVLLTTQTDIERVNGFSNEYWGHGYEDTDIFLRLLLADVNVHRKPGRYRSLPHKPAESSFENIDRFIHSMAFAVQHINAPDIIDQINKAIPFLRNYLATLPESRRHNYARGVSEYRSYKSEGLSTLRYELLSRKPLIEFAQFNTEISPAHELITVKL